MKTSMNISFDINNNKDDEAHWEASIPTTSDVVLLDTFLNSYSTRPLESKKASHWMGITQSTNFCHRCNFSCQSIGTTSPFHIGLLKLKASYPRGTSCKHVLFPQPASEQVDKIRKISVLGGILKTQIKGPTLS